MNPRALLFTAFAAATLAGMAGLGLATSHDPHSGHGTGHGTSHGMGHGSDAATAAYIAAMDRMHAAMAADPTGDPDVDFARGMIPHHEGAIDMARIVLEHGTDPELKTLAEGIIAAQEAEIAFLRDWLARKGH